MNELYIYSLIPVLSVSTLLCLALVVRGARPGTRGLALFCAAIALWTLTLVGASVEALAPLARRFAASGALVASAYVHLAYEFTGQRRWALVWLAWAAGVAIMLTGVLVPGMLYDPVSLSGGPMFWPGMTLAIGAATLPLWTLARALADSSGRRRLHLVGLLAAGVICYLGAWANALMLAHGHALPYGMFLVLASLFILAGVVQDTRSAEERRLLDHSLMYSALGTLLSAGFLFGAVGLVSSAGPRLISQYQAGAVFLVVMALLAVEPVRRHLLRWVGQRFFPHRAAAPQLARALVEHEARAAHAEQLAQLGAFTSAIAHEVRNPLGVLQAHMKILELQGVDAYTLDAMSEQIQRASDFLDELLHYGRPRPLEIRQVAIGPLAALAASTARQGRHELSEAVTIHTPDDGALTSAADALTIEADQAQLLQVLIILLDNAILCTREVEAPTIWITASTPDAAHVTITVEDNGPGIPEAIAPRLFEPFVTGRKRDSARSGTGLGLAIAHRVITRHEGTVTADRSETRGGARFTITLPRAQPLLGAAPTPDDEAPT